MALANYLNRELSNSENDELVYEVCFRRDGEVFELLGIRSPYVHRNLVIRTGDKLEDTIIPVYKKFKGTIGIGSVPGITTVPKLGFYPYDKMVPVAYGDISNAIREFHRAVKTYLEKGLK